MPRFFTKISSGLDKLGYIILLILGGVVMIIIGIMLSNLIIFSASHVIGELLNLVSYIFNGNGG